MKNTRKKKPARRQRKPVAAPTAAAPATHLPGLAPVLSAKPPSPDGYATAQEISILLADPTLDEPALRRASDPKLASAHDPARGTTWLPPAIAGRWQIAADATGRSPVWAGLHARARHEASTRPGLPETFANMQDFCARTRTPRTKLDYALAHGCPCRDDAGRIHLTPYLEWFAGRDEKIYSPTGLERLADPDLAGLDISEPMDRLNTARAIAQERENALAAQTIHTLAQCEHAVRAQILSPLLQGLQLMAKTYERFGRSDAIAHEILGTTWPKFRATLRAGQPDQALTIAASEPDISQDYSI